MRITSSGDGRCSAFASSQGARIQTSRFSSVVKITGIALGWIVATMLSVPRQETIDEMWVATLYNGLAANDLAFIVAPHQSTA